MNQQALGFFCSAGAIFLLSGTAQAQNTAGALQLALGTDVVTYNNASETAREPGGDVTTAYKTTRWGFADHSGMNFEGGYGLGDSLVLGGIVGIGGWSRKQERTAQNLTTNEQTNSEFDLLLAPKLDYMLMPGQSIRPFFGGAVGVKYYSQSTERPVGNNGARTTNGTSATGLALMARVGVRFFLTPGFSLDPAFMFVWVPTASGSSEQGAFKYDLGAHGYTLGLTVAASGWIGL